MVEYPRLFLSLITTTILSVMFCMTLILYSRWGSRNYLYLTLSTGSAFIVNTVFTMLAAFQVEMYFQDRFSMLATGMYLIVIMGFYFLFIPKKSNKHLMFMGGAATTIFIGLIYFFVKGSFLEVLIPAIIFAYLCSFWYFAIPHLPKQRLFTTTVALYGIGILSLSLYLFLHDVFLMNIHLVCSVISYYLLFIILFDRIVDLMQAVSYSSVTDGLTGLLTKNYFISKVKENLLSNSQLSVLFVDIDNFKKLNDTKGHAEGDLILKLTAKILMEICEDIGYAGRYGGEELIALITDSRSDPSVVAERFRERVEKESKAIHPITVSIGYRKLDDESMSAAELIKQADDAMYIAKNSGKNQVVKYNEQHFYPKQAKKEVVQQNIKVASIQSTATIEKLAQISLEPENLPKEESIRLEEVDLSSKYRTETTELKTSEEVDREHEGKAFVQTNEVEEVTDSAADILPSPVTKEIIDPPIHTPKNSETLVKKNLFSSKEKPIEPSKAFGKNLFSKND